MKHFYSQLPRSRAGITLVEVLIAIGIIAIGLTSVMSLIPAGKSEAGKAVVYDRAATMAMNGLNDAVTFGLTRPDSFVVSSTTATTVVFDPSGLTSGTSTMTFGTLKAAGVLADSGTAAPAVVRLFAQGRDDLVYTPPVTADDLPTNNVINGIRGFEGRMTSLFALTEADAGSAPLVAGDVATLSVVVFHNRDLTTPIVTGTMSPAGNVVLTPPYQTLPTGRTLKSVLRPGSVIYFVESIPGPAQRVRFAQLAMAAVDTQTGDAYVTLSGRPAPSAGATISILIDSVGLAEQTVTLEGPSPYGQ
jgi:Tfp pilus assembly protein FimT